MSEKELFDDLASDKSFKEQAGTLANQKAKQLAKEKSKKEQKERLSKCFYTVINGKVLKKTVTLKGTHTEFIKKKAKMKTFDSDLKEWKKNNEFVPEENITETAENIRKELIKSLDKKK